MVDSVQKLNKRLITSFFLTILFFGSIYNNLVLVGALFVCFVEILFETNYILNRIFKKRDNLRHYVILLVILLYVSFLIINIWIITTSNIFNEHLILLIIISTCVSTDIGGYFFGNIFKGKKLTKISPNKTYSGMYGSFITSIIINFLLFNNYLPLEKLLIFSFLISLVSQMGDLFISLIKRKAKIKDAGIIFPGHGGCLDRFDGIVFAIPFGIMIFNFL